MLAWIDYRMQFLDELLRHDGLQDRTSPPPCSNCLDEPGVYKCLDCNALSSHCTECIVWRHDEMPLHRIEVCRSALHFFLPITFAQVWSDGFFQRTSLFELGFSLHIGHQRTSCPSPDSTFQKILVIDVNGAHYVSVQFCACKELPGWIEYYRQLLRMKWYPASLDRPKTAFTFDLLDTYHKLALQGKLSVHDFFAAVMQKSDNCGRRKVIVSKSVYFHPRCLIYSTLASIS